MKDDFNLLSMVDDSISKNKFSEYKLKDFTIPSYNENIEFHPNGHTHSLILNDSYFMGLRADHFILVDGETLNEEPAILIIANHKGFIEAKLLYKQ